MNIDIERNNRIYINNGNPHLLALIDGPMRCVLDIGCGSGANAHLIKQKYPHVSVSGVTISGNEADSARTILDNCWVFDVEGAFPEDLLSLKFDTLIFSHVLEHLKNPASVLAQVVNLLEPNGQVLIAVPNVLNWRQRLEFLFGRFEYQNHGIMDNTHLRFFTYYTATRYLLAECPHLTLTHQYAPGTVPLWYLRRKLLPEKWCSVIDRFASARWPNLFGGQVIIRAIKTN